MNTMRASGSGSKRTSQGRRKIEIKKIEKKSSRQVTFSKRRGGLFNKASELCIITGAHTVILIANDKHVYSFGHPTPDAVIDRYLRYGGGGGEENLPAAAVVLNMEEYNKHYAEAKEKLDLEKGKAVPAAATGEWWEDNIDGKGVEELEMYAAALDELRNTATSNANDLMVINKSNSLPPPLPAALIEEAPPMSLDDVEAEFVNGFINNQVDGYEFGQEHV